MARSSARLDQPMVMVKDAGLMNYAKRRTNSIRSDRQRRMVAMQSLRLMVTSGVVRRAEMDYPRHPDDCADIDADPEVSVSLSPPVDPDEPGWLTRFVRRQTDSSFTHARHTT